MPRPLRSLYPPGAYHVYARGVDRARIFRTGDDCREFLELLRDAITTYRWSCHAFCLMGTHYHLVLETRQPFFSTGMQWLNGQYASWFNTRYGRRGHLFGSRFGAVAIESERQLIQTCDYVLGNPVRAGLCDTAGDWPWSAARLAA